MNIVDSIHQRLPELTVGVAADTHHSASGSEPTAEQRAPFGWIVAGAEALFEQADRALERHAASVGGGSAPSANAGFAIYSESDVRMAAAVYLVNPVNVALLRLHPELTGRLYCGSQLRFAGGHETYRPCLDLRSARHDDGRRCAPVCLID
jgi:hypothetical protein